MAKTGDFEPMPWLPHTSTPQVHFEDGRYWVIYEGHAFAAFKPQDDTNALDYCNGFVAGLSYGSDDDECNGPRDCVGTERGCRHCR